MSHHAETTKATLCWKRPNQDKVFRLWNGAFNYGESRVLLSICLCRCCTTRKSLTQDTEMSDGKERGDFTGYYLRSFPEKTNKGAEFFLLYPEEVVEFFHRSCIVVAMNSPQYFGWQLFYVWCQILAFVHSHAKVSLNYYFCFNFWQPSTAGLCFVFVVLFCLFFSSVKADFCSSSSRLRCVSCVV